MEVVMFIERENSIIKTEKESYFEVNQLAQVISHDAKNNMYLVTCPITEKCAYVGPQAFEGANTDCIKKYKAQLEELETVWQPLGRRFREYHPRDIVRIQNEIALYEVIVLHDTFVTTTAGEYSTESLQLVCPNKTRLTYGSFLI
ncbi:hypothetical protein D3C78_20180 [compost metagenome]